jgi:hypothetical protein
MSNHKIGELVAYTSSGGAKIHIGIIYKIDLGGYYHVDWANPVKFKYPNLQDVNYNEYEIENMKHILDKWLTIYGE